ncbi:hypothetical protein G3I77_38855 [Streptomyces sp. D2-8]|uniref:hypothetical protein n=1 Tax=Streptomyces sp. D2-8 TaxID=2707767 RepID=UPI0020C0A507|nr:hypothetical protein [Streptomyces sp. D2-8]MCK8438735.1 hypothetical protein [Streptomyces sp. D2-8]
MIHNRIAQAVVALALGVGTLLPSAAMAAEPSAEPAVLAADTLRPRTGTWGG